MLIHTSQPLVVPSLTTVVGMSFGVPVQAGPVESVARSTVVLGTKSGNLNASRLAMSVICGAAIGLEKATAARPTRVMRESWRCILKYLCLECVWVVRCLNPADLEELRYGSQELLAGTCLSALKPSKALPTGFKYIAQASSQLKLNKLRR